MSSLSDMRKQLRELRKEHVKPVSRMKKGDITSELERLQKMREETPAAAAVPSAKSRPQHSAVETVKKAKEAEFPVRPAKKATVAAPAKAKMTKAQMRALIDEMSSDEE